jgi:carbon monoxide dehydrogenase subunit G
MLIEGTVNINAPREKVWEYLTDPEFVCQCAPGVTAVEVIVPDQQFKAIAVVGFGAVKLTFETQVEWIEVIEHDYAKMKAHGNTPGSGVDVISEMHLVPRNGTTDLNWKADVIVVGQIANTAARLMSGIATNLTNSFFLTVKEKIEA